MFENLSDRLEEAFKKFKEKGKLSSDDIKKGLREVRLALLEADVNYKVVKSFINRVEQRALSSEVIESLTPFQQIVKIVYEELVKTLGGEAKGLDLGGAKPAKILLAGLQGSGKTTTAAKLARFLKKKGHHPLLVSADIYRPAAIEQLKILAQKVDVPFYEAQPKEKPLEIVKKAIEMAKENGRDIVIIDTAGRLHIDEDLMQELMEIKQTFDPSEVLLVADAMMGQDSVNVAKTFNERVGLTGIVLTKIEGDARGGAALSIKEVTGCPIKFLGVGEKLDALEVFYPERLAGRILGMGDVLTLIEKAQEAFDIKRAKELEKKIKKLEFDLEDLREQLRQMKKLGSIRDMLEFLPGIGRKLKEIEFDEKELVKMEAIINSMTKEERKNPRIINASRKRRIARGSGTTVQDVNKLLRSYEEMLKLLKQMRSPGRFQSMIRRLMGM
ncbi:MAG: Signal recognition particle GTPase [Thermodesulfobacterium sp.]|uniref:Signal recognition particle protein n=1 Tax=Candidatus Thermodesulfobacterium syntrophicum TaxID=3060442 RepID=A0AAE3TFX0_9BACT|nr:Signal recognition particle GTPase [Candidatus Thermodesulfobacterium syntrophicum]